MYVSKHPTDKLPQRGFSYEKDKESSPVQFGVLGPLRIAVAGSAADVAVAPKVRTVLAMLLLHTDQVVPVPALMRDLWNESPPATGLRTLQTYILNCRKLLAQLTGRASADIARDTLVTRAGGYSFTSACGPVDWLDFQRLTDRGGKAIAAGDDRSGIQLMEQALELWRGDALADVPAGPVIEAKRRLLEESRLGAIGVLSEARIRKGMHREVTAQLVALTSEHQLHEGLHAQYMRALALSGRRAEALEVFSDLRVRLAAEIGIDPGYPLQQLQLAILKSHTGDI